MTVIFHIAEAGAWSEARADGMYRCSTLGRTLEEVGFIHCSHGSQVKTIANALYSGRDDVILLVIDTTKVRSEIREERLGVGDDFFPHIYGPLNIDAVIDVRPLEPGPGGRFTSSC